MTFGRQARVAMDRVTASVVACLFALQVLLATALSAQMTVSEALGPYTICVNSGETPPKQDQAPTPHPHEDCAVCAFAVLSPLAPLVVTLLSPPTKAEVVRAPPARPAVIVARLSDPRSSRGPPVLL